MASAHALSHLAAIYSVYDGEELLEGSIATLRRCATTVIAVAQTRSNVGEFYEGGLTECRRLLGEGMVDVLCVAEPDPQLTPAANETAKRQLGLTIARHLGASHFCFVDCDEFYEPSAFAEAWDLTVRKGWDATVCPLRTYFRFADLQLTGLEDYWVPWIHRLHADVACGFSQYPFKVDPTLRHVLQVCIPLASRVALHAPFLFRSPRSWTKTAQ